MRRKGVLVRRLPLAAQALRPARYPKVPQAAQFIVNMVGSLSWQFPIVAKICLNKYNLPVYCSVCGLFNSL